MTVEHLGSSAVRAQKSRLRIEIGQDNTQRIFLLHGSLPLARNQESNSRTERTHSAVHRLPDLPLLIRLFQRASRSVSVSAKGERPPKADKCLVTPGHTSCVMGLFPRRLDPNLAKPHFGHRTLTNIMGRETRYLHIRDRKKRDCFTSMHSYISEENDLRMKTPFYHLCITAERTARKRKAK